jgi:uncharacterized glyoxalase superfamily protein PhnB
MPKPHMDMVPGISTGSNIVAVPLLQISVRGHWPAADRCAIQDALLVPRMHIQIPPCPSAAMLPGAAAHGEVRAGEHVIWLHPAGSGYRSPRALGGASGMTVVAVDDADAHHARSVEAGAEIIEEPADQPYAVREYGARDLEGQLWFFHSPIG